MRVLVSRVLLPLTLLATHLGAQQTETMRVNADKVNLRTSPSIDSSIVRALAKGTVVTVLSREGQWVKVQAPSATGWVRANLLDPAAGAAPAAKPAQQAASPPPPPASTPPASRPAPQGAPPTPRQDPAPSASTPVSSGPGDHPVGFKDSGTATIISVLITGGGQFYTGETGRGALLLAGGVGSVIVGCGIAHSLSTCELGLLADLGFWIYGIIDAGPSARRMNAQNGYKISMAPIVIPAGQPRVGLAFSVHF